MAEFEQKEAQMHPELEKFKGLALQTKEIARLFEDMLLLMSHTMHVP